MSGLYARARYRLWCMLVSMHWHWLWVPYRKLTGYRLWYPGWLLQNYDREIPS